MHAAQDRRFLRQCIDGVHEVLDLLTFRQDSFLIKGTPDGFSHIRFQDDELEEIIALLNLADLFEAHHPPGPGIIKGAAMGAYAGERQPERDPGATVGAYAITGEAYAINGLSLIHI